MTTSHDIFVLWKRLQRKPCGWDPDLDDRVHPNTHPFIKAGMRNHAPNVKHGVDRGKDLPSAPRCHLFNGERRNNYHTTLAEKRGVCVAAEIRPVK